MQEVLFYFEEDKLVNKAFSRKTRKVVFFKTYIKISLPKEFLIKKL